MANHVRLVDFQRVHDGDNVVACDVLTIFCANGWHVRGRITALAVSDAAMRAGEKTHLHFPGAIIAGIFVDEYHR